MPDVGSKAEEPEEKHFGNMTDAEIDALLGPIMDALPDFTIDEMFTVEEAFGPDGAPA